MSNTSKKQVVANTFKATVETVTEVGTVAFACVKHTPKIAAQHAAKVNKEMDDIFAALLS